MKNFKPIIATLILCFAFVSELSLAASQEDENSHWVASWGASPFSFQAFGNAAPTPPLADQTIRQILRLSVGGTQVRIRFSNEVGDSPLTIGTASLALANDDFSITGNTLHKITFGGSDSITIPAGAPALSDPIDISVNALDQLAVSLYLPQETAPATVHMGRIAYISGKGDYTQAQTLAEAEQSTTMLFLSGVYVKTNADVNVLVAFGDSITDGTASTPYTYNSWPDHLVERFSALNSDTKLAVINHGIAGNQVLADGAGDSALGRFDQDVLSTPGLTHIIIMEGINDIGTSGFSFPGAEGPPPAVRSAEDIIAGYQQLISRAHAMSPPLKIYGATLTPFEGTFAGYYTPEKDLIRHEVNEWIRSSGVFDAVIDFDQAIWDPENTNIMKAEYNSGDNLHPGDAGYKRMAESIDLDLFGL